MSAFLRRSPRKCQEQGGVLSCGFAGRRVPLSVLWLFLSVLAICGCRNQRDEKTTVREYYDNGQLKELREVKKVGDTEVADGLRMKWWKNGQIALLRFYVDGKEEGASTSWLESGRLEVTGQFYRGKKHGAWTAYGVDGEIVIEERYVHGLPHGVWTIWKAGRRLREKRFERGVAEGVWRWWDEEGNIVRIEEYSAGALLRREEPGG